MLEAWGTLGTRKDDIPSSAAAATAKAGGPTGCHSLHTWWQWAGGPRRETPTLTHRCGAAYMGQPVLHPAPAVSLLSQHVTSAWGLPWVQAPYCLSLPALPWARTWHVCPCTTMHRALLNACMHRCVHPCAHMLAHLHVCTPHPVHIRMQAPPHTYLSI